MIVDDEPNELEDFKKQKLLEYRTKHTQNIVFNSEPIYVGKIISRGFNNRNRVYMGPYGGLFYLSRVSGMQVPVRPKQKIDFNTE